MRFYPDELPPYPDEPTRDRFEICQVDGGRGRGVISRVAFQPGEWVFVFTGFLCDCITQHSLQLSPRQHIHDPYFMGLVLHHCEPNCRVDIHQRVFIAIRPIAPQDLITMDYESTEDRLYRAFECRCGSPACRGRIEGRAMGQNR